MAGGLACLQDYRVGETLARWSTVWSSILLGVGLGFLYLNAAARRVIRRGAGAWAVLWAALAMSSLITAGSASNACGALSGLFLLLTGLSLPAVPWPELWRYLANLAYGAFLTHFAFFLLLQRIGFKGDALGVARFVIVVAGAFSAAELLQSFPLGRIALGMKREAIPARLPAVQPRVPATTAA
jgi:hypothetical protein